LVSDEKAQPDFSTVYHIQLVSDEKAQPDSYIRRTTL